MRRCPECGAPMRWKLVEKEYPITHKDSFKRGRKYYGRRYWCPKCGTEPLWTARTKLHDNLNIG